MLTVIIIIELNNIFVKRNLFKYDLLNHCACKGKN